MATPIPDNHASFRFAEISQALGLALPSSSLEETVCGVSTDSRCDLRGKLFVALRGERFDGHDFVEQAIDSGAAAVVVEEVKETDSPVPRLVVPSTWDALGALARWHRMRCPARVLAVAGSAGKTTTRTWATLLLEALDPERVHSASGNLNNRVGVPMVLLGLEERHRWAVVEIGTNRPGEVEALTRVARPDVAVLTLIDLEHTEGLSDLDGVEREEAQVFCCRPFLAVGNGGDQRVRRRVWKAKANERALYGDFVDANYRLNQLSVRGEQEVQMIYTTPFGQFSVEGPWLARPTALALLGAIAAVEGLRGEPIPNQVVASVFCAAAARAPGRLSLRRLADGTRVIDDSYNANPASVRAAIEAAEQLARQSGARLHLVLGEMRELGRLSVAEHRALGSEVSRVACASLTAVCGDAAWFAAPRAEHSFVEDSQSAAERVLSLVEAGDVVLVKGSRGVRTDLVVSALVEQRGLAP